MDLPITDQPGGFTMPNKNPDNLAGLEVLGQMSELMIKQRHPGCLELMECWEYQNKYDVFDQQGGNIFFLKEESGCLDRCCCANARALEVSFQDLQGNELLRFDRPLRCMEMPCDCCYPNYTQLLEIYHQDRLLGKIREVPQCCARKHLEVFDQKDQKIFDISGPCCPISCGGDVNFPIENSGGISVGEISKKWRGLCAESFTDTDTFKIDFPVGADVTTKAILMGATMLVDYMFFERKNDNNSG